MTEEITETLKQNDKPGGYISKIVFNNGEVLDVAQNDIVVFVGPNNAGKSQSLRDIYELSGIQNSKPIVIKEVKIVKCTANVTEFLKNFAYHAGTNPTYDSYIYQNQNFSWNQASETQFHRQSNYEILKDLFVAFLNTEQRLFICQPAEAKNRNEPKDNPILYAAFDYDNYAKWLSDKFFMAFGEHIIPNINYGRTIPLCMGETPNFSGIKFKNEQEHSAKFGDVLATYKQVQDQGDGIKSFTGILLYLMMDNFCTYLIDEPESFLHPPQARIMGEIIGESLKNNQQAFISTHSEEIIKGLIDTANDRLKLVRITRDDDTNHISVLNNTDFAKIWKDPLLKYSNIMSGLFHKTVILCESDSDCKFYSIVDEFLHKEKNMFSENLYIHCGGKQRMSKVVAALKSLDVAVKLIPDIDVLNDETIFKGITNAFGIEWESIEKDYKIIYSNLNSASTKLERSKIKAQINQIIDSTASKELTNSEIKQIKEIIKQSSRWDTLKNEGANALPRGEISKAFKELNIVLKQYGIYIVPVGELENFIKESSGHGPVWVNNVLEEFSDISSKEYQSVKEFLSEIVFDE